MTRRTRALAVVAALASALALAGCRAGPEHPPIPVPTNIDLGEVELEPGQNGVWLLDGPSAVREVIRAARGGGPSVMTGTMRESIPGEGGDPPTPGRGIELDVRGTRDAHVATYTAEAQRVELVVVDGRAYVKGNAAYAARTGIPEVGQGWVCTSVDDPLAAEWVDLATPSTLIAAALSGRELGPTPPLEADSPTADIVIGSGNAPVGAMKVAASGPPLPTSLVAGDATGSMSIAFSWGEPVEVVAPSELAVACG
jgi:hypothetical protein